MHTASLFVPIEVVPVLLLKPPGRIVPIGTDELVPQVYMTAFTDKLFTYDLTLW
jgi:hypothetical protein